MTLTAQELNLTAKFLVVHLAYTLSSFEGAILRLYTENYTEETR